MELADANAYLSVIKAEQQRRATLLADVEPDELAHDEWLSTHAAFIGLLCLVFLVALWHDIERRLLHLAACAADGGQPINKVAYKTRIDELLHIPTKGRWGEIGKRLDCAHCAHYVTVKALQLLANTYKHDPGEQPTRDLLKHLKLDATVNYAALPESGELQKGLALIVGLSGDAGYCEITERFVERVQEFLKDLQARNTLSRVNWGPVSLDPKNFLH